MALVLVVYPPGAGGNHLKNLLCLPGKFANSDDLDPAVYDFTDSLRANGEVWMKGGRNLQDVFFDRMDHAVDQDWILPAHFGELRQYHSRLDGIAHKQIVLITIDTVKDRRMLDNRQMRLGQAIHPYWLDEELIWLYQPETYDRFFNIAPQACQSISLQALWSREFVDEESLARIEKFLDITVPRDQARLLHHKWHKTNFAQFDPNQNLQ